jgi:ComF family protein
MGHGRALATTRLLLDALFPGRCVLCGSWLLLASDHAIPVCDACRAGLSPIGEPHCSRCGMPLVSERGTCLRCRESDYAFESNIALFTYAGGAGELIGRFKFEGRKRLAGLFAALVAECLNGLKECWPVVPAPPRPGRQGPDAVELVARCLSRVHKRKIERLLVRTGGVQQKSLDFEQRKANLHDEIHLSAFAAALAAQGGLPEQVVLMDDVFTTGATLDACARVLLDAGCSKIHGVTFSIEQ